MGKKKVAESSCVRDEANDWDVKGVLVIRVRMASGKRRN